MARTPELKKDLKRKTGQTLQLTPFRTIILIKLTHFGPKARRGSDFYLILVLLVLAKKVGQIGVVIRKYFDFVEGSSQFSIQISENSGKRWK